MKLLTVTYRENGRLFTWKFLGTRWRFHSVA